jgi:hypothetical protein
MNVLLRYFLCVSLIVISGCASLFSSAPKTAQESSANPAATVQKKSIGLEVVWEVPSEPTDGFVIRYGEDRGNLSKEVTILLSELREEKDPIHGPIYRYVIRDISTTAPIFVSVAAFKDNVISDFSEAIEETKQPLGVN